MSAGGGERARLTERLLAEQEERRRIAELIHDGPVQHVAAITQMLDAAAQAIDAGDDEAARGIVARALAVSREASGDLRELVAGIEPATLHEQGFAATVSELSDRIATRRRVSIELDVTAGDDLGQTAQIGLYQIVRESLDQAVRRGPPTRVSISLERTPGGGAELIVSDDGAGERRQAVIDGLAERAASLNGEVTVERAQGAGTTVRVLLPPSAAQR